MRIISQLTYINNYFISCISKLTDMEKYELVATF